MIQSFADKIGTDGFASDGETASKSGEIILN